ncbi:STAS domain-containing protein [Streptacidiphilus neutrinimicus]|uniref:STAS domain-containing protein n=1 Tax=Streptacidiphilus neutrinimicus TaxID=105420 RepID=UPI0006935489|nr:STAS domain-containing protein [Streptacidiphilus neutrinimicus]
MRDEDLPLPWRPGLCSSETACGDVLVYRLSGELDSATSDALAFDKPLDAFRAVVVDMADVGFFGSTALNALLSLRLDAQRSGVVVHLSAAPRVVARVLEITGADALFPTHRSLDAALRLLGPV